MHSESAANFFLGERSCVGILTAGRRYVLWAYAVAAMETLFRSRGSASSVVDDCCL
jgi:hypothetical protein